MVLQRPSDMHDDQERQEEGPAALEDKIEGLPVFTKA